MTVEESVKKDPAKFQAILETRIPAIQAALNELLYLGYEVTVFNNAGREIDFRAEKDNKVYLIQVAYSVAEEKAYDREFSACAGIDNLVKKIIITNDDIDYSTGTVYYCKFKDFLMLNSLDEIGSV